MTRPARKSAGKASARRAVHRCGAKSKDSYITTLDGWCRECTAKLRKLVADHRVSSSVPAKNARRRRKRQGPADWFAARARQVGLGLRKGATLADPRKLLNGSGKKIRHVKFNRVTDFCKKEWRELASLASRLNELASNPPPRERRRKQKQ